ncbi:hypothetical protein JXA63_04390 [Candidatus Woesebacteria bacterium]|nr:hypothetical protein [Candidatus Woesebacteria bacterium]
MAKQNQTLNNGLRNIKNSIIKKYNKILRFFVLEKGAKSKNISLTLLASSYVLIAFVSVNFEREVPQPPKQQTQTLGMNTQNSMEKERSFWTSYMKENPNYIDGWLELTKIEYETGNIQKAIRYLEKAKDINPNLNKVKDTETELGL